MIMKILNKRLFLSAATALLILPSFAQKKPANVLDLKYSIQDSEIIFPESYETDTQKLLERWYLKNYTTTDIDRTSKDDPGATPEQVKERLKALPTIIDMPYNSIVQSYIDRYVKKGRQQVTQLLGLATYYLPIFVQKLEAAGLPDELKYLPIIESGLDPRATSKSGAAGLWQFMPATAQGYDMEVNSLIDERRDLHLSTEKACNLLSDLYNTYGKWDLAIAAYNCGPGTVNKALSRAGGNPADHDFWSIYYYLPAETRGYVPMFIAANYVMNYYDKHDIAPVLITKALVPDTVLISERLNLNQVSAVLDIPIDELRILNPQYRADIIPASADRQYPLTLPSQQIHAFIVSKEEIFDYNRDEYMQKVTAVPGGDPTVTAEAISYNVPSPVEEATAEFNASQPVQSGRRRSRKDNGDSKKTDSVAPITSSGSNSSKTAAATPVKSKKTSAATPAQEVTATTAPASNSKKQKTKVQNNNVAASTTNNTAATTSKKTKKNAAAAPAAPETATVATTATGKKKGKKADVAAAATTPAATPATPAATTKKKGKQSEAAAQAQATTKKVDAKNGKNNQKQQTAAAATKKADTKTTQKQQAASTKKTDTKTTQQQAAAKPAAPQTNAQPAMPTAAQDKQFDKEFDAQNTQQTAPAPTPSFDTMQKVPQEAPAEMSVSAEAKADIDSFYDSLDD